MDLFLRLLVHMARWSRRRPRKQLVIGVCVTLLLIAAIAGIEAFIGWPEALTVERLPRNPAIAR
ncbi:MAG: phage tail protein [Propylenella sp.]